MRVASISRVGGREYNEDYVGKVNIGNVSCFVVADGLGGHSGGAIASSTAVEAVLEAFKIEPRVSYETLYSCMLTAQNSIVMQKEDNPKLKNMLTTLVVLITDGEFAIWGHVGDSRLYWFEKKKIQEITDDHSIAFAAFLAGECFYDEIRTSPDQNKLTRTLGNPEKFNPQISDVIKCGKKTAFLLCTDGFWEYVKEDIMEATLSEATGPKDWLLKMLKYLDASAPEDNDNYSAVVITAE